jgi:hypothetical protein
MGTFFLTKELTINFIWSVIVFPIGFVLIILLQKHTKNSLIFLISLLVVLVIDLFFVNYSSLRFVSSVDVVNKNPELMTKLTDISPKFRVYTPSYSISQEQGAFWGVHQVNGVDPLQLRQYVNYFEMASGIEVDYYSVTLPPFENGNPEFDNHEICPNIEKLQELNTKFIVSSFALMDCNLGAYERISNQYVYNIGIEDNYLRFHDCPKSDNRYSLLKYSPNEIVIDINSCGGILQISEINYPGWKIFIDGKQVSLDTKKLFREVSVPLGQHELRMVFKPSIVFVGMILQAISWLILIFLFFFIIMKKNEA